MFLMINSKTLFMFILLVVLSLSSNGSAQGQLAGRQTTEIGGVVQTPSGEVIPNATITVRNKNTGQVTTTTSDSQENFKGRVEPGVYDVEAEQAGFAKVRVQNVSAQFNQSASLIITFDDTQPVIPFTRSVYIKGRVKNARDNRPIENAT